MKKVIFILTLVVTFQVSAWFNIVGSSFNSTDSIELGSQQWIDVQYMGGTYNSSTRTRFYMIPVDENGNESSDFGTYVKVFDELFYGSCVCSGGCVCTGWYPDAAFNPDGVSKRITFNLPASFPQKKFKLSELGVAAIYGLIKSSITTGILDYQATQIAQEVKYYTLLGIETTPVEGFYIKRIGAVSQVVYIKPE